MIRIRHRARDAADLRTVVVRPAPGAYHTIMLDWSQCPAVERSSEKVSSAWVFKGTRVPVRALFENLEAGASINDFLE